MSDKLTIHIPGPTPDQVEYVRKVIAASVIDPDDPRLDARVGPVECPKCFGSGLRDIDGVSEDKCSACDGAGA